MFDPGTRRATLTDATAVDAVTFMRGLWSEGVTPRLDESAVRGLDFRASGVRLFGVPVAMMPTAVGGGFGLGSATRVEFTIPMPGGAIAAAIKNSFGSFETTCLRGRIRIRDQRLLPQPRSGGSQTV